MRKKSKYKPKGVILNPVAYVLESMTPLRDHSPLTDVKIKNHGAMHDLIRGQATKRQMDFLIQMHNICEALARLGHGSEHQPVIKAGGEALYQVCCRGATTQKFICKSEEINQLNDLMELHDAQLEVITVKDMEKAVNIVRADLRARKALVIKDRS